MDASTRYGNAVDFDTDLHSVYAAYLGQFEAAGLDWWDKSWGGYFATFNDFLGFGWEVMVVVDSRTGRAHIAVRREQIALFAKMIRTRFGESLAKDPPTTLPLSPAPTRTLSLRRLIQLPDLTAYRKLSLTLPAAELSHLRHRTRSGDVAVAEQLFYAGGPPSERGHDGAVGMRDNGAGYTFAAVRTTWWEKGGPPSGLLPGSGRTQGPRPAAGAAGQTGKGLVLEVGIAVVRCANLRAVDVWPPVPAENYRKSHFISEEWVDKRTNQNPPSYPRGYAFGKSQYIADKDVERILDANLGALASQENDSNANTLILLTLGEPSALPLPSTSTLPANVLHLDVLSLEYNLLRRAQEQGLPGTPGRQVPLTSLSSLLQTLQIPSPPFAPIGNAGNEAYYTLLAFQKLMMAQTRLPDTLFSTPESYMSASRSAYPGAYPTFPQSASMAFPPYPQILPPPQPPFTRPPHSRRESSSSSRRQSELFAPPTRTKSPGPANSPKRASQALKTTAGDRSRPASFGDAGGSGQYRTVEQVNGNGHASSINYTTALASREDLSIGGSAPSTVRVPGRGNITRSSTIFWDDAEYADADLSSSKSSLREQTRLRQTQTAGTGSERDRDSLTMRGRQPQPPPSAMRHNSSSQAQALSSAPNSRTVSWSEERIAGASSDYQPGGTGERDLSVDRRSTANLSATGLAGTSSKGRPALGRGSSAKFDSGSSSEVREPRVDISPAADSGSGVREKPTNRGRQDQAKDDSGVKQKENGSEKPPKMKSEKSMRNVAGALARFWVG